MYNAFSSYYTKYGANIISNYNITDCHLAKQKVEEYSTEKLKTTKRLSNTINTYRGIN